MTDTSLRPRGNGFLLPSLPNVSTSSLMDAVVGDDTPRAAPAHQAQGYNFFSAPVHTSSAPQPRSDVFGDASNRVNKSKTKDAKEPPAEEVQELERNLQKRSLIPHLENELAALEAQIKAAEERLSRATAAGVAPGAQRN